MLYRASSRIKIPRPGLGRGAPSKSTVHSPPQTDRNWKPINTFATRLGRQMGAAHNIYTRVGPKQRDLRLGNWNVTSLNGKELELVWETEQYHRQILLEFPLPSVVTAILLS